MCICLIYAGICEGQKRALGSQKPVTAVNFLICWMGITVVLWKSSKHSELLNHQEVAQTSLELLNHCLRQSLKQLFWTGISLLVSCLGDSYLISLNLFIPGLVLQLALKYERVLRFILWAVYSEAEYCAQDQNVTWYWDALLTNVLWRMHPINSWLVSK